MSNLFQRLPTSSNILKVFAGLAAAALIHTILRRRAVKRIKDEITSSLSTQQILLLDDKEDSKESLKGEQELLVREQLSRNYAFLGDAKQEIVCGSFVVIVGLGGVGSHAVRFHLNSSLN
jgi:hypothetical protein